VSTIASPADGATVQAGVALTLNGTATDTGGGMVPAVEVSTDGGMTWHRASGTTSWTYNWTPTVGGSVTLMTRAVDDSLNLETPHGITISVSTTAPLNTSIASGPSGVSPLTDASFAFSATRPDAVFECAIDGSAYVDCTSPTTYFGLGDGGHTFSVRAIDGVTIDTTPASRAWTIDTTPPAISNVQALPSGTSAVISWTTGEASDSRVEYGTGANALTSAATSAAVVTSHTVTLGGLTPGATYFYRVRSQDGAGNASQSPDAAEAPLWVALPVVNTVIAAPAATAILAGSARSGTSASLSANDNGFFEVNSTTSGWTRAAERYGEFTVQAGASNLRVTYSGANSRSCSQTIAIYRWTTQSWVQLDSRTVSTTEVLRTDMLPSGSAADYINAAGQVRVRVRTTSSLSSHYSRGDFLSLKYDR
jgi:hypothetical protein